MNNLRDTIINQRSTLIQHYDDIGVPLHALRSVRSHFVITHHFALPPGKHLEQSITKLQKSNNSTVLTHLLGVKSVRVDVSGGTVAIQVPVEKPSTPTVAEIYQYTTKDKFCIGFDTDKQPALFDAFTSGAIGWLAPSGSGKTQSMMCTLLAACVRNPALGYCIICQPQKLQDWAGFNNKVQCYGIVSDPYEIKICIDFWAKFANTNTRSTHTIILIDDVPSILQMADIEKQLGTIASNGRSGGVHLWLGTQQGSKAGTGDTLVGNSMSVRILYKAATTNSGGINAGESGMNVGQLTGLPGDGIIKTKTYVARVATGFVTPNDYKSLKPGKSPGYRVWMKTAKPEAQQNVQSVQSEFSSPVEGQTQAKHSVFTQPNTVENTAKNTPTQGEFKPDDRKYTPSKVTSFSDKRYIYNCYLYHNGSVNAVVRECFGSRNQTVVDLINSIVEEFSQASDNKILKMRKVG